MEHCLFVARVLLVLVSRVWVGVWYMQPSHRRGNIRARDLEQVNIDTSCVCKTTGFGAGW